MYAYHYNELYLIIFIFILFLIASEAFFSNHSHIQNWDKQDT